MWKCMCVKTLDLQPILCFPIIITVLLFLTVMDLSLFAVFTHLNPNFMKTQCLGVLSNEHSSIQCFTRCLLLSLLSPWISPRKQSL